MPENTNRDYANPHLPPATPPVIDPKADAGDAAHLANADGDSDSEGTSLASVDRSSEDEDIPAGDRPDEVFPDKGDVDEPSGPAEIEIERGDTDEPGKAPDEVEPLTRMPPD